MILENNKNKSDIFYFFILQIVFWTIIFKLRLSIAPLSASNLNLAMKNIIFDNSYAILLSFGLRYIYLKYDFFKLPFIKIMLLLSVISLFTGFFWYFTSRFFTNFLFLNIIAFPIQLYAKYYWFYIFSTSYPFLIWSTVYIGFYIYKELLVQRESIENFLAKQRYSQFETLRYKINPDFLFNTLSSLKAEILLKNNEVAEKIVTIISEFLKYALLEGKENKAQFIREIRIIQNYIELEKIRLNNLLQVDFFIDPQSDNIITPVFLIYPIIENAISNGSKYCKFPLLLTVKTQNKEGNYEIEITFNCSWNLCIEKQLNEGIFKSTKNKLEVCFPEKHLFEIIKNTDSVTIKIILTYDEH